MLKKILKKVSNLRITGAKSITPPIEFIKKYPADKQQSDFIVKSRKAISKIINGKDNRLIVIVGPCSIHDPKSALEYAQKLSKIRDQLSDKLLIIMRVYFEKPRTTIGWKGLIYDPDLDNTFKMKKGFGLARHLLLELNKLQIPCATEYLDLITPQYISDLISWGAIGARTTESQTHRELASGLSCPVGFKNGTSGNTKIAIDAIISASMSHMFWSINKKGMVNRYTTSGNPNCHIILRGGISPNYDKKSVDCAVKDLKKAGVNTKLMIDFSHANSAGDFNNQIKVGDAVASQIAAGSEHILGVMIESHLFEGKQKIAPLQSLKYGVSITDACLSFDDTAILLKKLAKSVKS